MKQKIEIKFRIFPRHLVCGLTIHKYLLAQNHLDEDDGIKTTLAL